VKKACVSRLLFVWEKLAYPLRHTVSDEDADREGVINKQLEKCQTGDCLALAKTFEGNDEVRMLKLTKNNILFVIMAMLMLLLSLQGCYVGFYPGHGYHDHGRGGGSESYSHDRHGGYDRHR